jgi:hypothetical protein
MAMYPNMMHPIPFIKHKSKHPSGIQQDKTSVTPEKNEGKNDKKEDNLVDSQNKMKEEPKQEE